VTRYNSRGTRSASWKLKAAAGGAAVVAGVSGGLALLELKGMVRQVGGMQYVRLREASQPYAAVE